MSNELSSAMACIVDALASSIDPSGVALQLTRDSLREGFEIAGALGGGKSEAATLIGGVLEALERVEVYRADKDKLA